MTLEEALATVELLHGQIAAMQAQLDARGGEIVDLRQQLALKGFEVAKLRRALYGDKTERVLPEELTLPGLDLCPSNDVAPKAEERPKRRVREHLRDAKSTRRARLEVDPARVTEKHVYVDPESTTCACCQQAMAVIGEERSSQLDRDPATFTRTTTHRRKWACARCRGGGVCIATAQDPPITGAGPVGVSLAVDIAVMHFADHLPFHRMVGIFAREGLSIDRGTLSRVAARVAAALRPLVDAMERELLASECVLGVDGTHVKVLAKRRCERKTIYVLHGLGHVVFRALQRESADHVLAGFASFRGVMVSDAAKVHLGQKATALALDVALCNAHGRRNFFDARDADRDRANHALAFFQEVAHLERTWSTLDAVERQRQREQVLTPRLEAFYAWMVAERPKVLPRGPMATAIDYALRHWGGLTRFLSDGRVPWTNNESERLLRHIVVGRNAWTFRGSFEGARSGCVLWSLMMSCRVHGLDPRCYLLDVLAAFESVKTTDLLAWTPREYAARRNALAKAS